MLSKIRYSPTSDCSALLKDLDHPLLSILRHMLSIVNFGHGGSVSFWWRDFGLRGELLWFLLIRFSLALGHTGYSH